MHPQGIPGLTLSVTSRLFWQVTENLRILVSAQLHKATGFVVCATNRLGQHRSHNLPRDDNHVFYVTLSFPVFPSKFAISRNSFREQILGKRNPPVAVGLIGSAASPAPRSFLGMPRQPHSPRNQHARIIRRDLRPNVVSALAQASAPPPILPALPQAQRPPVRRPSAYTRHGAGRPGSFCAG